MNRGSFPPPALPPGSSGALTNLSATPRRPACPSRASGWSSLTSPWGFPCCVRFPCAYAAATTPVQRLGVLFALLTQPCQPSPERVVESACTSSFSGLLGVHASRCAALASWLHQLVAPLYRRLQPFRHLHVCSGCFRLERLPGGAFTHWKSAAFPLAHTQSSPSLEVTAGRWADPFMTDCTCTERRKSLHFAAPPFEIPATTI